MIPNLDVLVLVDIDGKIANL